MPLEHYLYAGKELFKVVDYKKQFISQGWKDAHEATLSKKEILAAQRGLPKGVRGSVIRSAAQTSNPRSMEKQVANHELIVRTGICGSI